MFFCEVMDLPVSCTNLYHEPTGVRVEILLVVRISDAWVSFFLPFFLFIVHFSLHSFFLWLYYATFCQLYTPTHGCLYVACRVYRLYGPRPKHTHTHTHSSLITFAESGDQGGRNCPSAIRSTARSPRHGYTPMQITADW